MSQEPLSVSSSTDDTARWSTTVIPRKRNRLDTSFPLDPDAVLSYLRELAHRLNKTTLTADEVTHDGQINAKILIRRFAASVVP